MSQIVVMVLSAAMLVLSARAGDSGEPRYAVMSISLGDIEPDSTHNALLFMSLYFDLDEDLGPRFPPHTDPVYAEIRTILVTGGSYGDIGPYDSLYGQRMVTEEYFRGNPDFEADLVDYRGIAPWFDLDVDTPRLDGFHMRVSVPVSSSGEYAGHSRDLSVYHSPYGLYEFRGSVRSLDGSGSLRFDIAPGAQRPDVFMYNISFADSLPVDMCTADVNRDGEINFFDVTAFIDSYRFGCP